MQTSTGIKDMPLSQRPYEKCLQAGCESLSDAELLGVILRTGTKGESSVLLSQRILNLGGRNLSDLYSFTLPELMKIRGVGKVKAIQILCLGELSKRIAKAGARQKLCFSDPRTIADYYMEDLRCKNKEHLLLMMLDTKTQLIKETELSVGTVNATVLSPRELYIEALRFGAVHLILVHNHPSGDPSPSREDVEITQKIMECGKLLGISLLDHIVIGNKKYYSMREQGLIT